MLGDTLLTIVCLRRTLVVEGWSIEVLKGKVFLCCFVVEGGQPTVVESLLVYKIKNRFQRLGVLFDYLSG